MLLGRLLGCLGIAIVTRLQAGLAELGGVEAKRAQRDMPSDVLEALSAFSNTPDGGAILLGIDENAGFDPGRPGCGSGDAVAWPTIE